MAVHGPCVPAVLSFAIVYLDCHRSFSPALDGAEPLALYAPHVAALTASTSSTIPHRSDRLLLIHDPVPLGLARRPPLQHGQTSPPSVPRTWSCQPSRVGPTRCRLLSGMRVPSTPGKPLAGCLGAQSATMPPTSGLPDCQGIPAQPVAAPPSACGPCLYHLGCTTWG